MKNFNQFLFSLIFVVASVVGVSQTQAGTIDFVSNNFFTVTDTFIDGTPDILCTTGFAHTDCPNGHRGFVSNANVRITGNTFYDATFSDFNISGLSGAVTQAELIVQSYQFGNGSFARQIHVSSYDANGLPELSDFLSPRSLIGTLVTPSQLGQTQISMDVTSALNSQIGSSDFFGAAFTISARNSQAFICPTSQCSTLPILRITTSSVPEPEFLGLLSLGLFGLTITRRKQFH